MSLDKPQWLDPAYAVTDSEYYALCVAEAEKHGAYVLQSGPYAGRVTVSKRYLAELMAATGFHIALKPVPPPEPHEWMNVMGGQQCCGCSKMWWHNTPKPTDHCPTPLPF